MDIPLKNCLNSGRVYALENGFRYEFPSTIAEELIKYLDGRNCTQQEFSLGEWVLSLPFGKRMSVNIQLTNYRNQERS